MFELDRNPDSRMISEIRDLDKDQIIFPFKQPHQSYNPIIKDLSPKFVITGNIQKKRRKQDSPTYVYIKCHIYIIETKE